MDFDFSIYTDMPLDVVEAEFGTSDPTSKIDVSITDSATFKSVRISFMDNDSEFSHSVGSVFTYENAEYLAYTILAAIRQNKKNRIMNETEFIK